jgi:rubrerythrin
MKEQKEVDTIIWRCPKCGYTHEIIKIKKQEIVGMLCPTHICNFKTRMEMVEE